MPRKAYDPVTLPILIPCAEDAGEGFAGFLEGLGGLTPVRTLRLRGVGRNTLASLQSPERERLFAVMRLLAAVKKKDQLAIEEACVQLAPSRDRLVVMLVREFSSNLRGYPQEILAKAISKALRPVRLVLWRKPEGDKHRFVPALFCHDVATGLFVYALLTTVAGTGVSVCLKCGNVFVYKRPDQVYCSSRCREAHRVARYRERMKLAGKK